MILVAAAAVLAVVLGGSVEAMRKVLRARRATRDHHQVLDTLSQMTTSRTSTRAVMPATSHDAHTHVRLVVGPDGVARRGRHWTHRNPPSHAAKRTTGAGAPIVTTRPESGPA